MRYEDCAPGRRVIHEMSGPAVIVRPSAQLVVIRPDRGEIDVLAFPDQLRPER